MAGEAATSNTASRWPRKAIASALTQNRKFILEHMSNSLNFYLNGFKSFNQLKSVNTFMNNLQIKFSSLNLYLTTYIITTYIYIRIIASTVKYFYVCIECGGVLRGNYPTGIPSLYICIQHH